MLTIISINCILLLPYYIPQNENLYMFYKGKYRVDFHMFNFTFSLLWKQFLHPEIDYIDFCYITNDLINDCSLCLKPTNTTFSCPSHLCNKLSTLSFLHYWISSKSGTFYYMSSLFLFISHSVKDKIIYGFVFIRSFAYNQIITE